MASADKSIGRVFIEVGVDLNQLNKGFDSIVKSITDADGKVEAYGKKLKSSFEAAYNPTLKLGSQLEALAKQGRTAGELIAVFGDRIQTAMEKVAKTGAKPNEMVANLAAQMSVMARKSEEATQTAESGFKKFGEVLTNLVAHPLQAAQSMITKFAEALGPVGIGLLGIGTAIAAGATALYKFIDAAHEAHEQLENMSLMTGISINDLKALRRAVEEAGFEGLDLGRSLSYINDQLASTGKAGDLQKGMDALGISARDANGQLKSALVIVDELGAKIAQTEDPVRQASDMIAVFGIRYRELGAFALKSGGHIQDTVAEIQKAGGGYTKVAEDMLEDMHTAQKETGRYFDALTNSWLTNLGEIWGGIKGLKDKIESLPGWFQKFIGVSIQTQNQFPGVQPQAPELPVGPPDPGLAARIKALDDLEKKQKAAAEAAKKAEEERQKQITATMELEIKLNDETRIYATLVEGAAKIWKNEVGVAIKDVQEGAAKYDAAWKSIGEMEIHPTIPEIKTQGETFGDTWKHMGDFAKSTNGDIEGSAKKTADTVGSVWKNQVSTIVTDWSRGIADILVEGGNFGQKLTDIFKETAKSILRILIETLFNPLKSLLMSVLNGIMGLLGIGGNAGGVAGATGAAGFAGLAGGSAGAIGGGILAGLMLPKTASGKVLGGIAGGVGGLFAAGGLAAGGALGGGIGGFMSAGVAALSLIPVWGWAAMGVAAIAAILGRVFTKNAFEAGAMEVTRDLGGINVGQSTVKSFFTGLGLSESQSYPIRKDLLTSPAFITQIALPAAQAQGRVDQLVASLSHVTVDTRIAASGFLDFGDAVRKGINTGDWGDFNTQWERAFKNSTALMAVMPDLTALLVNGATQAADAVNEVATGFQGLRDAISQSLPSAKDMYQVFWETGEILPDLNDLIVKYGGNIAVWQKAADLPGLRANLTSIGQLTQGLMDILPEEGVIQRILGGEGFGETGWAELAAMGLDPSKLVRIADLASFVKGWEPARTAFEQTGILPKGGLLEQAIWQFGGPAGMTALQNYGQGFNTITPALLNSVQEGMNAAFKAERSSVVDYLQTMSQDIQDKIDSIGQAIVNDLDKILFAIMNPGQPLPANLTGGVQTVPGGTNHSTTQIIVQGDVYGYDDFERKVQTAWNTAHRRGAFSYAVP